MTEQAPEAQTPPWGDAESFDAEKAWTLIQNLRDDNAKLKDRPVLDDVARQRLAEYETLKKASQSDLEKAQGELSRWQGEAETWRRSAVASTVRALAAADFEYPEDAVAQLDPGKYLDAGGQIDERSIRADLKDLLDKRPNWRRAAEGSEGPRPPRPNPAQGAGGTKSPDPAQEFASILHGALQRP